jgi:hypothetical protein
LARWISRDPAESEDDPYNYCRSNPINQFDPDGANPVLLTVVANAVNRASLWYVGNATQFNLAVMNLRERFSNASLTYKVGVGVTAGIVASRAPQPAGGMVSEVASSLDESRIVGTTAFIMSKRWREILGATVGTINEAWQAGMWINEQAGQLGLDLVNSVTGANYSVGNRNGSTAPADVTGVRSGFSTGRQTSIGGVQGAMDPAVNRGTDGQYYYSDGSKCYTCGNYR